MTLQNKMTTREREALRSLRSTCKSLDITLDIEKGYGVADLRVTAPAGFCFDDGLHEFIDFTHLPWHNDYSDVLDRISANPPRVCGDAECDWCLEL